MADNKYIYAVARIRSLEMGLLNDQFIEQLIAAPDTAAAERLLSEKGWEEDLSKEESRIWSTVKELGVDMSVFDVLTLPKLYHNLKTAIKAVVIPGDYPNTFYEATEPGRDEIIRIVREKDWNDLPERMRGVAKEAYESFTQNQDGQLCDVIVDKACLEAITEAGSKSKEPVVRDYANTTVAVTDIKIAVRCAKTGKTAEFAKKAIAPCQGIDADKLAKAAAGGTERVIEYLKNTSFKAAAEAIAASPSEFECWCDNETIRKMKPQKMNAFTAGPLFAFVIGRQNEIKTVRIVLAGKDNGLTNDAIRERVREMYG